MEQFIGEEEEEEEEMKNRFKTGNDDRSVCAHGIEWSVHARGGKLIHANAAALGVFGPTVLDVNLASSAVALDSRIENDRSIRVNCDAADSKVDMEETAPIAATAAVQQRFKKKEKGHIGPNHGDPGRLGEVGQHSSTAEAVPMILAACLTTGINDLSVRGRGGGAVSVCDRCGELNHATVASGLFDSTTSDATNDQVDPLTNVEGKAQSRNFWIDFEVFSRLFR
jgi:hypothetical protein